MRSPKSGARRNCSFLSVRLVSPIFRWSKAEKCTALSTVEQYAFVRARADHRLGQYLSAVQAGRHGRPRCSLATCRPESKQAIQALCAGYHEFGESSACPPVFVLFLFPFGITLVHNFRESHSAGERPQAYVPLRQKTDPTTEA